MADDTIKLSEASPEELQRIQHGAVRALAVSTQAVPMDEFGEEEIVHLSIIIDHLSGPPGVPDY
jgi:hypothetical protein